MKPIDRALVGLAVVAILATVGALVWVLASGELGGGTPIEDAAESCESDVPGTSAVVGDEGESLTIAVSGNALTSSSGDGLDQTRCLLDELEAPDSMRSKIDSTTAAQGRQEDSWDDYEASWTYHPDTGLTLIIEES